jgi:hypothetical protein
MKKNPIDRMKDPFYAQLIFSIEGIVLQADEEAKDRNLRLYDSQIKSALVKTRKRLRGGDPEVPQGNEKEELLAKLVDSLCHNPDTLREIKPNPDGTEEEIPIERSDYIRAVESVERSLKNHRSDLPGSRLYLDFLHRFLRDVRRK